MVQDKTPFCVSPKSFSWNWALDFLSSPGKNVSNSGEEKGEEKKVGVPARGRICHLPKMLARIAEGGC
jgi:hypothetical protein